MKPLALLLLTLLICSCSTQVGYKLDEMPKYDIEVAAKHYLSIAEVTDEYQKLNWVYASIRQRGFNASEAQHNNIIKSVDVYLYWLAVANIQLFHSEYENMAKSIEKASGGLDTYKSILVEIVHNSGL